MTQRPPGGYTRREILNMLAAGSVTLVLAACGARSSDTAVTSMPTVAPATGTAPPDATAVPTPTSTPAPWRPPTDTRITPNADFYTLKYNPSPPPDVNIESYRLVIDGEVEMPLTLTLDDIKAFPATTEMRTLQCISNPVGGNLIGNAIWTGVPLPLLLEAAGAQPSGRFLKLESLDSYHTGIPIDLAMDDHSLLVYQMNGEPLPVKHGFPLRCLWPGRYGQKQPKWINQITLQRQPHTGHWEGQGWSDEALIQPTAIIEQPGGRGLLPPDFYVGGIANATREGVEKVEVSLDDGNNWQEAELLRGPSPLVWTHWWLKVKGLDAGVYRVLARTTDNRGRVQTLPDGNNRLLDDTFPDGTDEMHRIVAQVRPSSDQ